MNIAKVVLSSASPYSQSKNIDPLEVPKKPKESANDYEERTWMHRIHSRPDGRVFIPCGAIENSIREAAKRLAISVPGKGKTLYSKYFEAGFQVANDIELDILASEVKGERRFVPSDGRPGGGKRVYKRFPCIMQWSGSVDIFVFDDIIVEHVFRRVLESAGMLVGIGRFRPQSRGFYGKFKLDEFSWQEAAETSFAAE